MPTQDQLAVRVLQEVSRLVRRAQRQKDPLPLSWESPKVRWLNTCSTLGLDPPELISFHFTFSDINELTLPKTCQIEFPDNDDLLNFKLIICPDEVTLCVSTLIPFLASNHLSISTSKGLLQGRQIRIQLQSWPELSTRSAQSQMRNARLSSQHRSRWQRLPEYTERGLEARAHRQFGHLRRPVSFSWAQSWGPVEQRSGWSSPKQQTPLWTKCIQINARRLHRHRLFWQMSQTIGHWHRPASQFSQCVSQGLSFQLEASLFYNLVLYTSASHPTQFEWTDSLWRAKLLTFLASRLIVGICPPALQLFVWATSFNRFSYLIN